MLTHGRIDGLADLYQTGDLADVPIILALHAAKMRRCAVEDLHMNVQTTYWTGAIVEERYEWPGIDTFGYDLTDPIEFRLWNARQHHHAMAPHAHVRAVFVYLIEWDEGCRIVVPEAGIDRMGRRLDELLGNVRLLLDVLAGIDFEEVDMVERTPFMVLNRDQLVIDLLAEPDELIDYASGALPYKALQASRLMDSMLRQDGLLVV